MIREVTIDELRWFLVLADTQNVTRAAELLHITQPTLSRALRRLEREAGAPLFDRHSQRVHLNEHGESFVAHAQRAVREIDRAGDVIAASLRPGTDKLRIAFLHSFGTWLVPDLLGAFGRTDPSIRFTLHQDSADAVVDALRTDRADLILVSPQPVDPLIEWVRLQDEPLALAVPLDHRLAGRTSARLTDIVDEDLIAMQPEFGLRQITDAMFRRRGSTPAIVLESAEIATIRALVATGLGVAVIPDGAHTSPTGDLALIPLEDNDAFRSIGLAWHLNRSLRTNARRFRHYVTNPAPPESALSRTPPR